MVNPDWDLRGYLSHLGNHRVVHYIPETAQGVLTDALSISFLFFFKLEEGLWLSITDKEWGRMDGAMMQIADSLFSMRHRSSASASYWGKIWLPCLLSFSLQTVFRLTCIISQHSEYNLHFEQTSVFSCFWTQPGWKMRSWATKVTRQPWVSGQGAEFLGLGEVTDHRQSHLDGEMYF